MPSPEHPTGPAPAGISRTTRVEAGPEAVWALVSDLPRMGDLSPENAGGRWLGGATGPAVGARFKGRNRNGWRRWSTTVTVEECEPGRVFAFRVSFWGVPVSRWRYDVVGEGTGTLLTESWTDRRPAWFRGPAGLSTGVMDRTSATAAGIEATLAAVRARLEQ